MFWGCPRWFDLSFVKNFDNCFMGSLTIFSSVNSKFSTTLRCWTLIAVSLLGARVSAQDVSTGLLAHFQLDGNLDNLGSSSLSITQDDTSATYVADRFGTASSALQFTDTDYNLFNGAQPISGTGINLANSSLTVSFWYRKDQSTIGKWAFFIGGARSDNEALHVSLDDAPPLKFAFFNDDLEVSPDQTSGQWYHFAGTFDAVTMVQRIYLDGIEIGSRTASANFVGDSDFGFGVNGLTMDDIRVYNRALSATDIVALSTIPEPASFGLAAGFAMLTLATACRRRSRAV